MIKALNVGLPKLMPCLGASAIALSATMSFAADATVPAPLYKPASEIEIKVQAMLQKHCSRCHQEGLLEEGRAKPAKNFGNTMQLDQLLVDVSRVKPGNADGSRIFQMLANKEMPYDVYQDFSATAETPTEEDVALLRTWIDGAGPAKQVACIAGDTGFSAEYDKISRDLGALPEHRRQGARYISLKNLAVNCANSAEMDAFRMGVTKLLNSLSTNPDVLKVDAIDEDKTILRFNLEDLNWTPELWETIVSQYPYGIKPLISSYDYLTQTTGTAIPLVRADWFAFTASRPPLYDKILGLPPTFQELQALLGVDVSKNIADYSAKRAGFQKSGVSANNRLIERHTMTTGAFWTSYDFGSNSGRQSLFQFPLGPGGEFGFEHNGGETIFSLPNGLQGYYLNTADGEAIPNGPTNIVRDMSRRDLTVTNGISCMGCHDQGMRNAKDEIRAQVKLTKEFPIDVREAVDALFPTNEEFDKLIVSDRARFQTALTSAGVDPQAKLNGIEIINALSDHYEREVDVKAAAAEFGVPVDEFQKNMSMAGGAAASMAVRLQLGTVQRDEFQGIFGSLVEHIIDARYIEPSDTSGTPAPNTISAGDIHLELSADKAAYSVGDKPIFTAQSNTDCHLTLIDVDGTGDTVVIFPNKFQQDNLIKAHQPFSFPNAQSSFDFALSTKGTETVIALCDQSGEASSHVIFDFLSSDFTELGKGELATKKIDVISRKPNASNQKAARTAIKIKVD